MGTKHMFPGGNTSKGFVNYFNGIIPSWEKNKRTYILKGGPGVGKNTFMQLLGKKGEQLGYEVRYYHCASDSESLDAVRIPELGITMLDGTAPHIIDPVLPGAADSIINLGIYLNEDGLEKNREAIETRLRDNSRCYQNTFAYLKAAGTLQENINKIYVRLLNRINMEKKAEHILEKYVAGLSGKENGFYKLFGAAYTPLGYVDHRGSIITQGSVIQIKGPSGVCSNFLQYCKAYLKNRRYGGYLFCDPLLPEEVNHLVLDQVDFSITSDLSENMNVKETIDLTEYLTDELRNWEETIRSQEQEVIILCEKAVGSLQESKKIHDIIEDIYKKHMDFEGITGLTQNFIKKVMR